MSNMIYGSFEERAPGARLVEELNTANASETFAMAHGAHLQQDDIQYPGTLSMRYSVVGAVLVGLVATFMVWGVMLPQLDMELSLWALPLLFLAFAPFGVIAGAIAGTAEFRPALAGVAERNEHDDRTVVTAEIPHGAIAQTIAAFEHAGAVGVSVA